MILKLASSVDHCRRPSYSVQLRQSLKIEVGSARWKSCSTVLMDIQFLGLQLVISSALKLLLLLIKTWQYQGQEKILSIMGCLKRCISGTLQHVMGREFVLKSLKVTCVYIAVNKSAHYMPVSIFDVVWPPWKRRLKPLCPYIQIGRPESIWLSSKMYTST